MFTHDMSSIRTTRFSSVRRSWQVMLIVAIAASAVGILTFAIRAEEPTKLYAPRPLVVVPGATINLLPAADGAKQGAIVVPQSPQGEFTGKLRLDPDVRLPPLAFALIPLWIIGDPAFQLLPNYEAGSAVAVFVAPKAPPTER